MTSTVSCKRIRIRFFQMILVHLVSPSAQFYIMIFSTLTCLHLRQLEMPVVMHYLLNKTVAATPSATAESD